MKGPAVWQDFPLAAAVAELHEAGLITDLLLPGKAGLVAQEPTSAAAVAQLGENGFLGARLDSRQLQEQELFVALPGEKTHGRQYAALWLARGGWVLTDVSSGLDDLVGLPCPPQGGVLRCADPVRAVGVLGRVWRKAMPARIVAVTGTNGKTTTKDFLAALLTGAGPTLATAGNFNNPLGLPVTLLALRPAHRFAVIEMGASAVGEIDYLAGLTAPHVGVITNASAAHLSEFGSLANIIVGKGELLDHLPADGVAVLNTDSPGWAEWQARARCPIHSLGTAAGDHRWSYAVRGDQGVLELDGEAWPLPLPGAHNANNLAAAILAARALGADESALRRGLAAFAGSAHRSVVLTIGGRLVLDDSYNANPASMVAAAGSLVGLTDKKLGGQRIAVLGHMAELGPDATRIHRQTGRDLAGTGLDQLVVVGEAARGLAAGFDEGGGASHYCASLAEAAAWLAAQTGAGDSILIKGSRSAAMEKLLPLLATAFGGHCPSLD